VGNVAFNTLITDITQSARGLVVREHLSRSR